MMRIALLLTLLLASVAHAAPEDDVRKLLDAQVLAWNNKDLAGYMGGYWKDDRLTFFSSGTVTHGWKDTLARYQQRYQGEGKEMGALEFKELAIEPIGKAGAFARGRWKLTMSDGKTVEGLFTVVLKKFSEGWRIVHDHSSL
jgi:beta-aspartyl-peptidase (threonine type)